MLTPTLTRARLLGACCAAALLAPGGLHRASAAAKIDPADITLLGNALALERALIKLYNDAAASKSLSSPVAVVLQEFMNDHVAHRDALTSILQKGGASVPSQIAQLNYPTLTSEAAVMSIAYQAERIGASSYLSTISGLRNRDYSQQSAAILGVEATHVALLAEALKKGSPYPGGFVVQ